MTSTNHPAPQSDPDDTLGGILAVTVPFALAFGVIVGLIAYALTPSPYATTIGVVVGVFAAVAGGTDATRRNLARKETQL